MALSFIEQLAYSTVRIECDTPQGISTGTGFFFRFNYDEELVRPMIVTNKHVIKNALKGRLKITKEDNSGNPIPTEHHTLEIDNFEKLWKLHPDPDVDLCAMPFGRFINSISHKLFYRAFDRTYLPTDKNKSDLDSLEDILMIGYPNGIWDSKNNLPICRKGITATHPNIDYENKKEFMIDAACFPGSSGSPVFLFNKDGYITKSGQFVADRRIMLLGVLYAGPQHTAIGEVKIVNIPQLHLPMAISSIPNNLGLVIKAERILELETLP